MSTGAIAMLVISVGVVWGGLILALLRLRKHPEQPEDTAEHP